MKLVIALLILGCSAGIGYYLDSRKIIQAPVFYWGLGSISTSTAWLFAVLELIND